ncbi:replication factor C large subunit [Methanosphaera sp.]
MKWVEKYAPKSLGDVLGNAKPKAEIEVWANKWSEGIPQKPLLLVGSPGIGKTTMAHLVGKEYFSETIEVNASDKRSYDILKRSIGEASQTRSLFQSGYKLLIMDEVDGISGRDDSGGARAINETIKNTKQPLIMMANDQYSKRLTTIKNKCKVIKFTKIHTNTINAQLKRICSWEDIKYDPDAIKLLSKQSNGDLRSAITSLEAIVDDSKNITMDSISVISKKDNEQNIFDTVRTVLKSKNPEHIIEAMRVDAQPQFLIELLAENIPREYERTNEIAEAYEMISLADVNLGRAFRTQNYAYWKYAFLFMGRGVANAKKETYKKFARYTNSTVYAKLAKGRKNKNLREEVTQKMSLKLHTSPKELEKQLPFYEILFEDNERAYDLKEYFKLTDDDVKLLRSRKIPASIEKKRMKELKKLQEQEEKEIQKQKALKEKEALKNPEVLDIKSETKKEKTKNTSKPLQKQTSEKQPTKEEKIEKPQAKRELITKQEETVPKKEEPLTKTEGQINKTEKSVIKDDKKPSKSSKKSTKKKSKQTTLFDF